MDTLKACINVDHIDEKCWVPPLVDADWNAFGQASYEGIEGSEWEELYFHHREMRVGQQEPKKQVGVKEQQPFGR